MFYLKQMGLLEEKQLIGCMLLDSEVAKSVSSAGIEFIYPKHNIIRDSIFNCVKNDIIDSLSVIEDVKKRRKLTEVGGEKYILDCMNDVSSTSNWKNLYKRVKINKLLEQQRVECTKVLEETNETELGKIIQNVKSLQDKIDDIKSPQRTLADITYDFKKKLERTPDIIPTGYPNIDKTTMSKGDFVILAARPSVGKSLLVINLMRNWLIDGRKVSIFTTEMNDTQFFERQMAIESQIPYWRIRTNKLTADEIELLKKDMDKYLEIYGDKVFFSDSFMPTVEDIELELVRHNPDILVLDNLSGGKLGNRTQNQAYLVQDYAMKLKQLALKYNCLMIVVAHLNREAEDSQDGEPESKHLRDSGSLEQIANKVIVMWKNKDEQEGRKFINWKFTKDRDGFGGKGMFILDTKILQIVDCYQGEDNV